LQENANYRVILIFETNAFTIGKRIRLNNLRLTTGQTGTWRFLIKDFLAGNAYDLSITPIKRARRNKDTPFIKK
jgi:hypothetical protein